MNSDHVQGDLFPETIAMIERIRREADRHYATGTAGDLTLEVLSRMLKEHGGKPCSISSIERIVKSYGPHGSKEPGVLPWPLTRKAWRAWTRPRLEVVPVMPRVEDSAPIEFSGPVVQWSAFDERGHRHVVRARVDGDGLLHLAPLDEDLTGT